MRVLGASVDLELHALGTAEGGLGKHALDGVLDDALGVLGHSLAEALELQATEVAGVTPIALLVSLVAGQDNLVSVDDDHEVTGVSVGGVLRLVLATKDHGSLGGKTAEGSALSVDEHPVALDLAGLGVTSRLLHLTPPT